jgi:hypothetical protein
VFDRLGEPEEIIAAETPRPMTPVDARGQGSGRRYSGSCWAGFAFGLGWLAGLILLWSSRAWTTRDTWIGTLVIPGGLAGTVFTLPSAAAAGAQTCTPGNGGSEQCTGGTSTAATVLLLAVVAVLVLAPFATSIYLAHRAR